MSGDPMLDGIARWDDNGPSPFGMFVLFSDLPALLAAVREEAAEAAMQIGRQIEKDNYAAGVAAAREAVADIPHTYWEGIAMCRASHPSYTEDDCNCPKRDALAAIDALRGESNG